MGSNQALELSAAKQIDDEMQAVLDQYLGKRRPVSLDDYDWDRIEPEKIDRDFLDALGFVTLVESNPEAPASKLLDSADRSNAPWLRRFITQTWLPEESMHHVPYREYLIRSGAYEDSYLDAEIGKVVERGFVHGDGYTELKAATYGWLQELITWRFYESMSDYLVWKGKQTEDHPDPILVQILGDIAKQENFHRYIYMSGVKTVLKYSPQRKREVVEAAGEFLMPGHHMAPDWQPLAPIWSKKFGFSHKKLAYDISRGLVELTGYNGLGQGAFLYAIKNEVFWYFKAPTVLLAPFIQMYSSPVNYLAGKLLSRASRGWG